MRAGNIVRAWRVIQGGGRPLKLIVRFRMRQLFALGLALLAALPVGTALGQTESQVRIQVLSDDTCLVYEVPVPCRDVGAKLRELGIPADANIHVSASSGAKYETVASTFESLKHAGFKFKLGYINVAPK